MRERQHTVAAAMAHTLTSRTGVPSTRSHADSTTHRPFLSTCAQVQKKQHVDLKKLSGDTSNPRLTASHAAPFQSWPK